MQAGHYSSLLPELFRHKTTKVRILQPQIVLLDFHGTICERKWENKVIFPYVKRVLPNFLKDNINNEQVQRCLLSLKNESFEQRFRYKNDEAPIIDDYTSVEEFNPQELAQQMADFVLWQMQSRKETKDTQIIERLVWQDGYQRKQIQTPLYEDVFDSIKRWTEMSMKIFIISSVETDTLRLLLESTDKGNLHQHLAGYVSAKCMGDKLITGTYKQFYEKNFPTSAPSKEKSVSRSKSKSLGNANNKQPKSPASLTSLASSQSSELAASKPILFLTDSGQEAKAASQVSDGLAYECLLVNRPGNKRIRTYYLTQFAYIERLDDIELVQSK